MEPKRGTTQLHSMRSSKRRLHETLVDYILAGETMDGTCRTCKRLSGEESLPFLAVSYCTRLDKDF